MEIQGQDTGSPDRAVFSMLAEQQNLPMVLTHRKRGGDFMHEPVDQFYSSDRVLRVLEMPMRKADNLLYVGSEHMPLQT